jgi:hypothetical protein
VIFQYVNYLLRDRRASGILRVVKWYYITDVSGQPVSSMFKGQALQEAASNLTYFLTVLNLQIWIVFVVACQPYQ